MLTRVLASLLTITPKSTSPKVIKILFLHHNAEANQIEFRNKILNAITKKKNKDGNKLWAKGN